ncbi:PilZ domain-containing protein [Rossellomorea aquimaris]|uniref:PilZ domain-containing protein n=1 Tax=Rossellomorea TaxID=2837508 RepID=UPI001CD4B57C|nr:PilZ domain-containing protein [Rossellomorea aquimaris]MCA1061388.1 PilZ domain-containing protein [Rossellomorea aquimaris]
MKYKRDEAYRFTFSQPIPCSFTIVGIGDQTIQSKTAKGEMIDLSPQGCRLQSLLDIHLEKEVRLKVTFKLDEDFTEITAVGVIQWKKKKGLSHYQYGVKFPKDAGLKASITDELKKYVKR